MIPNRPSVKPPVLGAAAHAGGRVLSNPALSAVTGAASMGGQVRRLVASAIRQRSILISTGRGHMDPREAARICGLLKQWLDRTNDHIGAESLRAFWRQQEMNVRFIMPGTLGGKRALTTLQRLCS